MSSLPPPSQSGAQSSGGNGKYIAIALLLLFGMGGIAFWKFHSGQTETPTPGPTVVATVASSAPTSPLIDDVPPPPPIIEAGPAPTTHYSSAGNPCEVTSCGGSVGTDTEGGLAMLARQTRRKCYEPALASDPDHVAIIRPNQTNVQSVSDLQIAQAGARNLNDVRLGDAGLGTRFNPRYFVHE